MNDSTTPVAGSQEKTLDVALRYLAAGFSVIPIKADGSKAPAIAEWKPYQSRRATEEEARAWWNGRPLGIAIIGGQVSGGLEVLDFEDEEAFNRWRELVESFDVDISRLPIVRTPGDGRHVYLRSRVPGRNQPRLARTLDRARGKWKDGAKSGLLIEIKAEGGYVLTPGCPPACHPTGKLYEQLSGPPIWETPVISLDYRNMLIAAAQGQNEVPDTDEVVDGPAAAPGSGGGGLRPGDDFNQRGSWPEILEPAGWTKVRETNGKAFWRRPGKEGPGWSATTGFCKGKDGRDLLYVFSSNAEPLRAEKAYSRFAAYTVLNFGGDFRAAARDLAARGYGTPGAAPPPPATEVEGPFGLAATVERVWKDKRGWLNLQAELRVDGETIPLTMNSTDTSIGKQVEKVLRFLNGEGEAFEVERFLNALFKAGPPEAEKPQQRQTARDVIFRAAAKLKLTRADARDEKDRAWSEALGKPIYQFQFLNRLVSSDVIDQLLKTDDFAGSKRHQVINPAKQLAAEAWATIVSNLPEDEAADLGPDTKAAREIRRQLMVLWTTPKPLHNSYEHVRSVSLGWLAVDLLRTAPADSDWQRVHEQYPAWCRRNAENKVELAMRWELLHQFGVAIQGVTNQASLGRVLVRCGLAVDAEIRAGGARATLLSVEVAEEVSALYEGPQVDAG